MEPEVLRDTVRDRVIALVLAGELKPGARIKELTLSRQLNVSRTPLREALISLERAGLVYSEPNIGFRVKEVSVQEAEELYPLLVLLESHAMLLAFPLVRTQLKELETTNELLYRKRKSPAEASLADRAFHRLLTEFCRNTTLLQMIAELRLRISCYEHRYMARSEQLEHSYAQHREIIAALREGNEEAAKRALALNWEYGMGFLVTELMREKKGT